MINILRTHRLSKLPDDGDPWAPNYLLTPEQKKNTSWTPVGQATDKKLRPQQTKMNSFKSGPKFHHIKLSLRGYLFQGHIFLMLISGDVSTMLDLQTITNGKNFPLLFVE